MEENNVQFTMRMDKDLYEQLKQSAQKNRRSIAKELEHITDDYLNHIVPINLPKQFADSLMEWIKNHPDT